MLRIGGIAVLSTLLFLTACSGGSADSGDDSRGGSRSSQASEPKTLAAAVKMSREEAARYTSEDYAGSWDLWTKAGKAAISRQNYAKYHTICGGGGIPLKVHGVRLEGTNDAVVRIGLGGFMTSYMPHYENHRWRWQPNATDMADYRRGVGYMIKKAKSEKTCDPS